MVNLFPEPPVSWPNRIQRKVIFVASVYGHLAAFHTPFMSMLQSWGCEVHAAAAPDGRKRELEKVGVHCWDIPFSRSPYSVRTIVGLRRLLGLFSTQHYDLVHVHTPVAAFLGRYAAKRTRQGAVIYTAHGFHFHSGAPARSWLSYYLPERVAATWTDGIIVLNREDFATAERLGYRASKDLFMVRGVGVRLDDYRQATVVNHLESAQRSEMRRKLGISHAHAVVTCVAELNPNKNHAFLLNAWRKTVGQSPDTHLLLVGTGSCERMLRRLIERHSIPNVHLLGFRLDVPDILSASDIFVLVSRREGLPRAIMEAMAAAKPIVATNVRGNRDLVQPGKNGLLVHLGDTDELAAALETLIGDSDMRAHLGHCGAEMVKLYSIEQVMRDMAGIYGSFLLTSGEVMKEKLEMPKPSPQPTCQQ